MEPVSSNSLFYFGYVARAHGIRGELRIKAEVDAPEHYSKLASIFIGKQPAFSKSYAVESLRWLEGRSAILKLKGVNTRNESEQLAGTSLYLDVGLLPRIESNSFYYHDVIGFDLVDKHEGTLASIQDIIELPGQDAFQLFIDGIEVLIPIVNDWILAVNFDTGQIEMQLPEGLVNLYLEDRPRKAGTN